MSAQATCGHCEELIGNEEPAMTGGIDGPAPFHVDCLKRLLIGSVAHVERRCSCFVAGSDENDPPGMTRREAAREAVAAWEARNNARRNDA